MSKALKQPTTYSQQVFRLQARNVIITHPAACEIFLSRVNYYRLMGYLLPFVSKPSELCTSPIEFEKLVAIYNFDTEIRNLIALAIEKIEIYLRTQLAYRYSHQYGSDGYMIPSNFNHKHNHEVYLRLIDKCIQDNAKSPVIRHHIDVYNGKFPLWVIIDYFSLGMLSHFYTDLKNRDKSKMAAETYGVSYQVLSSWLRCLTDLRNRCAHYSRLYYWSFPAVPAIPQKNSFIADRKLYSQLYMLKLMYPEKERWNNDFLQPLIRLMKRYSPYIDKVHIGFPYRWKHILQN